MSTPALNVDNLNMVRDCKTKIYAGYRRHTLNIKTKIGLKN